MKKTPKTKITIIGLGLIGGSLGLLLKEKLNCQVIGFSLHKKTLTKALRIDAIDKIANSLKQAIKEADLIFITTPISVTSKIFKKIAPFLKPNTIVTDVGSVKESIVKQAEKVLPKNISFIGGHPMAGKETRGIDHAQKNLLKDCVWILTPSKNTQKGDLNKLKKLIKQIGSRPLITTPKWHDRAVTAISHLPAVLSTALCLTVDKEKDWSKKQQLAAEGFRDTSRLAANPPWLGTDFCLENQKNISILIEKTIKQLKNFQININNKNKDKILKFFKRGRKIRQAWFVQSRFAFNQP